MLSSVKKTSKTFNKKLWKTSLGTPLPRKFALGVECNRRTRSLTEEQLLASSHALRGRRPVGGGGEGGARAVCLHFVVDQCSN